MLAYSVDPDQTAPYKEQSDQGLHCLPLNFCPNILGKTWHLVIGLQKMEVTDKRRG